METYASAAATSEDLIFEAIEFDVMKRENEETKTWDGKPVTFNAGLGPNKMRWFDYAPKEDYRCVMLLRPGEEDEYTRNYVLGYILKGSEAEKTWDKYYKKRSKYNEKGLVISGIGYYLDQSYTYPIAVVVKDISRD